MLEAPKLAFQSLTDSVYDLLREAIADGRLEPGSKVHVEELASQLGVSRTPVQDAFKLLAVEGLVDIRPRKGTYVKEYGVEDIAETLAIRRALELLACETIVRRSGSLSDEIEKLRSQINAIASSIDEFDSPVALARAHASRNVQFHTRIVKLSGNHRLLAVYGSLDVHLRIASAHLTVPSWEERIAVERTEHEMIVDALEERDAARLLAVMDSHLKRSFDALVGAAHAPR